MTELTKTTIPRDPLRILSPHHRYYTLFVIQMMCKPGVTLPNDSASTCYDENRVKLSYNNFRLWSVTSYGELHVGRLSLR